MFPGLNVPNPLRLKVIVEHPLQLDRIRQGSIPFNPPLPTNSSRLPSTLLETNVLLGLREHFGRPIATLVNGLVLLLARATTLTQSCRPPVHTLSRSDTALLLHLYPKGIPPLLPTLDLLHCTRLPRLQNKLLPSIPVRSRTPTRFPVRSLRVPLQFTLDKNRWACLFP